MLFHSALLLQVLRALQEQPRAYKPRQAGFSDCQTPPSPPPPSSTLTCLLILRHCCASCCCRFLERYKNSPGLTNPDRQGSVTVIRVDGAGVIHDVTPGYNPAAGLNPNMADSKADRYSCGPITIGGKGGGRTAAAATAGSNQRRHRQAGCFGMLAGGEAAAKAGLGPEARYIKEYEARLNPFAEFQVGPKSLP